jgi:hypothetical protein
VIESGAFPRGFERPSKGIPEEGSRRAVRYSTQDTAFYIGLDLGQSADYTALAVIEEQAFDGFSGTWVSPANLHPDVLAHHYKRAKREGRPPHPPLHLRHISRFELGTPYPDIVAHVKRMLDSLPIADMPTSLVIDKTGVGAAVVDSFVAAGMNPIAITIHGGGAVTMENARGKYAHRHYRVPKRDLVTTMQVLMQRRRLLIPAAIALGDVLKTELRNFRVKIDPRTAHDSYEHWREGDHDDLVLATAMACWFREYWNQPVELHYAKKERQS